MDFKEQFKIGDVVKINISKDSINFYVTKILAIDYEKNYFVVHSISKDIPVNSAISVKREFKDIIFIFNTKVLGYTHHDMTKMFGMRIAKLTMDAIKPADIARYRDDLVKQGFAPASILRDLALLSHVFTIARTEWSLPVGNPVKDVRKPRVSNARDRRLTPHEMERLLAACRNHRGGWLYDVVILAMETAMRRSEIASIRMHWINAAEHYLTLPDTKNGERRLVPLSPRALQAIEQLALMASSDRLVPCEAGAISHAFLRAVRSAKIHDYRFHDLRHEATSRLFEIGFNTMEAAAVTGHKSLSMLKRYTHLHASNLAMKLAIASNKNETK